MGGTFHLWSLVRTLLFRKITGFILRFSDLIIGKTENTRCSRYFSLNLEYQLAEVTGLFHAGQDFACLGPQEAFGYGA